MTCAAMSVVAVQSEGPSIGRLMVSEFRSYETGSINLDSRPVVLTGPNGAGKTNLLEALSLLSPGRGLRGAKLSELVRRNPSDVVAPGRKWAISAVLKAQGDEMTIGTGLEEAPNGNDKRIVRIDGETQSGPTVLSSYLSVVWLTPAVDRIFVEGASQRRKFLDRLVLGHDTGHSSRVSAFERAMRERQSLLERGENDKSWLEGLEATMAENAVAVAAARRAYVQHLQAEIDRAEVQDDLFPRADLRLDGTLCQELGEGSSALEIEDQYMAALRASRPLDTAAGRALNGPHRTDFVVHHRGKNMTAKACSTGEQKALLVGLILANARLRKSSNGGAAPLMLLDEIAAHLDAHRRAALFDEICAMGAQAWMTGTDAHLFEAFEDRAQYFEVNESQVIAQTH